MSNRGGSSARRRHYSIIALGLVVLIVLVAGVWLALTRGPESSPKVAQASAPETMPRLDCASAPETIEPRTPWRFKRDTSDAGVKDRWFDSDFDDSNWETSAPGTEWSDEYRGVGWYRASFEIPAEWETAYINIEEVDDTAQLWINGVLCDWNPKSGPSGTLVNLPTGQRVDLALRVVNEGGPGGIKRPVRVSRSPQGALTAPGYLAWLANENPEWPMPDWVRGGAHSWTFTGLPGTESRALQGVDGAVAPWATAPTVSLWIYDEEKGVLAPKPSFSLTDDSLPMPRATWKAAELTVETTLFRPPNSDVIRWQAKVTNAANERHEAKLLAVVRPIAIGMTWRDIYAAGFDSLGRLWVDGKPFMVTSAPATQMGVGTMAEVSNAARSGTAPASQNLSCAPSGDAAASAVFTVALNAGEDYQLAMDFPAEAQDEFPAQVAEDGLEATRQYWRTQSQASYLVIPDDSIMAAYRASLNYLMLSLTPNGPRPGPLAHAKLWVRDAAYIGAALLQAGRLDEVKEYLPKLFAHQSEDGRVPAIIASDGPEQVDEWDSQGEAIHAVAELYRYERDISLLERWEPNVRRAAEYLRTLRAQTKDADPSIRGLLPASASAEDLGPSEWHHYWDDFWGVAGLEEAAFIEDELGNTAEATWMRAEADELRRSIRSSIASVMGENPAFIPNAPEDLTSSAMARGTSVSLYPVEVFPADDPLIARSFDVYYQKWIAPNKGGYEHRWSQWWPYGGLGLARDYLRLGKLGVVHEVLGWTLTHQTLPGTYAWAEQVSPAHGGITGGDMPHAWAAASYVSLIREMLVMSRGDRLELFAGVPPSWLDSGKTVGVRDAPTEYGRLTALVESHLKIGEPAWEGTLTLKIEGTAKPSGGFAWRLPQMPSRVDGPAGTEIRDGWLMVPSAGGTVKLVYESQNARSTVTP